IGRVDDAMEVVADLSERVLRRLPREVAELVDTAALDHGTRPREPDGAAQAGMAVDDGEHRGPQAAHNEIVEATLPRLEGLASAELQGEQLLMPVGQAAHHPQHR